MNQHFKKIIENINRNNLDLQTKAVKSIASEMEKARKMAENSIQIHPTARELAKAARQAMKNLEESKRRFQSGAIKNYLDQHKAFNNHISSIINKSAFNAAITNLDNIQASIAALEQIQSIPFEEIYDEELDDLSKNKLDEPESDEYFLRRLFLYFRKKATELPNGQISAQGLVDIIIKCLILYYGYQQYHLSLKSETEADKDQDEPTVVEKSTIEAFKNELTPCLQDLAESDEEEFIVSIKRECPIRSMPTTDSDTLTRAFSGQQIEVVDSLSRWYQVKYFDSTDTTIKGGYIYKGHIQE